MDLEVNDGEEEEQRSRSVSFRVVCCRRFLLWKQQICQGLRYPAMLVYPLGYRGETSKTVSEREKARAKTRRELVRSLSFEALSLKLSRGAAEFQGKHKELCISPRSLPRYRKISSRDDEQSLGGEKENADSDLSPPFSLPLSLSSFPPTTTFR